MIISIFGEGKGKTTAALGIILRASGYQKKILFAQFIKGDWVAGEDIALDNVDLVTHKKFGLGFVGIKNDKLPLYKHIESAENGLKYIDENYNNFEIIILDEVFGAIKGGLLQLYDVIALLKKIDKKKIDIVATGRPRIKEIIEISDLVSKIENIKHPFDKGVEATKAIDY